MRIVVDNEKEYKQLLRMQKVHAAMLKNETLDDMKAAHKMILNATIDKSYENVSSAYVANEAGEMTTDDGELIVPYIVLAAVQKKKVAIRYVDGKGNESERLIEPFAWKNNNVVAFCHERAAWRHFKLANIMVVTITALPFDRDEDVEITAEDAKLVKRS